MPINVDIGSLSAFLVLDPCRIIHSTLALILHHSEIDGVPMCSNFDLLTGVLRDNWGFKGFVLADDGAVRMMIDTVCMWAATYSDPVYII